MMIHSTTRALKEVAYARLFYPKKFLHIDMADADKSDAPVISIP